MGFTAGTREEHRYQTCDDEWCTNYICRIYQEGVEAGTAGGFAAGHAAGHAEGFAEGYSAGHADAGE
jgi:hypothetical protein